MSEPTTIDGRPMQPDWTDPADATSVRRVRVPCGSLDDDAWWNLYSAFSRLFGDRGQPIWGDNIRLFMEMHTGAEVSHIIAYRGTVLLGCETCVLAGLREHADATVRKWCANALC